MSSLHYVIGLSDTVKITCTCGTGLEALREFGRSYLQRPL